MKSVKVMVLSMKGLRSMSEARAPKINKRVLALLVMFVLVAMVLGSCLEPLECEACNGTGACQNCKGFGEIVYIKNSPAVTCPKCYGTGKCPSCGGYGYVNVNGTPSYPIASW